MAQNAGVRRREYIKKLGIELYDIYGLTEIYGPGIGISCDAQNGMHYWDDYVYIEIIDPKTGKTLPDGEEGEIVITTLVKEGLRSSVSGHTIYQGSFRVSVHAEESIPDWISSRAEVTICSRYTA